ncbi:MAG: chorismate lyase [Deltaproteobacteria bacterium]|nr:chorismate lyase [Deltaproteobacteria bacterium]
MKSFDIVWQKAEEWADQQGWLVGRRGRLVGRQGRLDDQKSRLADPCDGLAETHIGDGEGPGLLMSRGSLTLELEHFYGVKVEVETRSIICSRLGREDADYLGVEPTGESLEREVWLTINKKRVVYASSVFPAVCTEKKLFDLLLKGTEPMGRTLKSADIDFDKDAIEIGVIRDTFAATDLGLGPPPLFARRYRLIDRNDSGKRIARLRCAVIEVFSPELVPADKTMATKTPAV